MMGRNAETLSFSLDAADRRRLDALAKGVGNRSEVLRHAIDLLEAEQLAQRLHRLQRAGDVAAARAGKQAHLASKTAASIFDHPDYAASERAIRIVAAVVEGPADEPPERARRPSLKYLQDEA